MKRLLEMIAAVAGQLSARLSSLGGVAQRLPRMRSATAKRAALISAAVFGVVGVIMLLVALVSRGLQPRPAAFVASPYIQRELLIPGFDYAMSDIEAELRQPFALYFVDPEYPLDPDLVAPLLRDRQELAREVVDERVRELLDAALRRSEAQP